MPATALQERLTDGIFVGIPTFPVAIFQDIEIEAPIAYTKKPCITLTLGSTPLAIATMGTVPTAQLVLGSIPTSLITMDPLPATNITANPTPEADLTIVICDH